jgi:hypothetical protein
MREVSISQLWNRAWDLFEVNWLLLLGLYVLSIIVSFIPFIGALLMWILLWSVLVRAGYLVARQGQSSFGEAFRNISLLLKVFVYFLILWLIPGILIRVGYMQDSYPAISILIVGGLIILFILNLFGWAGPYAILSGRARLFSAIGQSFSLTWRNFSKVFVALLSVIGLLILGLLLLGLGFLVKVPTLLLGGVLLCGLGLPVAVPIGSILLPLLYLALTGEEGVSHS